MPSRPVWPSACRRLAAAALLTAIGPLAAAASASASHYLRLANGQRIHWKSDATTTTKRTVQVFDNTRNTVSGNRWSSFVAGARVEYDGAAHVALIGMGALSSDTYNCPIATKGIVVCNYPNYNGLGSTGPYAGLAEFVLIYSTGHLSRGRVRLDDTHSGMSAYDATCYAPPSSTAGRCATYAHAVACQELGHELGLDHVAGATCMGHGYFSSSAFQVHANAHDIDAVAFNHSHVDGASAAAASAGRARTSAAGRGVDADPEHRPTPVIEPPAPNDCRRRRVDELTWVERVCGAERRHPDEIRIVTVIPPLAAGLP